MGFSLLPEPPGTPHFSWPCQGQACLPWYRQNVHPQMGWGAILLVANTGSLSIALLVIILSTWQLLRTRVPGLSLEACQVVLGGTTGGLLECLRGWVFLKPTLPHHHLHTAVTEMPCSGIRRRVSLPLLYHYMKLQLLPSSCDIF